MAVREACRSFSATKIQKEEISFSTTERFDVTSEATFPTPRGEMS